MSDKYRIDQVNSSTDWDAWVAASPQGTVFSETDYLENCGAKFIRLWLIKGIERKAGVVLTLSDDEKDSALNELVIYEGLLFGPDAEDQRTSKRIQQEFEITETLVNFLAEEYNKIEISCSPQLADLRPFLWHNYHSTNAAEKFTTDLRYTSYLEISELKNLGQNEEETSTFSNLAVLRQRNIRKARKLGLTVEQSTDYNLLLQFYRELMNAQGDAQSEEKLQSIKAICEMLAKKERGFLYAGLDESTKPAYLVFMATDSKRAYYLFGAGDPDARGQTIGSLTFWEAFCDLSRRGVSEVDLEGVNSPQRGQFKLSFGGKLLPYFELYKG